jgi:prepilin-type N-terminal cleavage/methylation domain-containing protein
MQHRRSAGYSLTELLIVISIIGVLSLITVPVFMNFQRQSVFKNAMRTVATDLRGARSNAIKTSQYIRVEFRTGAEGPDTKEYRAYTSSDKVNWTAIRPRLAFTAATTEGTGDFVKRLEGPVWFEGATDIADAFGSNSQPDIVFGPDGTADIANNRMTGAIILATNWTNIYSNRYNIYVTRSGQIKALPCQCMDGIDNDEDNLIDRNGLDTDKNGTVDINADGQCSSAMDNDESA